MQASDGNARTYLVECYSPDIAHDEVESAAERAVAASAVLRDEGCLRPLLDLAAVCLKR